MVLQGKYQQVFYDICWSMTGTAIKKSVFAKSQREHLTVSADINNLLNMFANF